MSGSFAEAARSMRPVGRGHLIARMIQATFGRIAKEPVPEVFYSLLGRLEAVEPHEDSRH